MSREVRLNHLLVDEALRIGPFLGSLVQCVVDLEPIGILLGRLLKLLPKEDVVLADIGIQQAERGGAVLGIGQDGMDDLKAGRNAGTAGDQAKVLGGTGLERLPHLLDGEVALAEVGQVALGSLHLNAVPNAERIEMLTHLATLGELGMDSGLVDFDHKGDRPRRLVSGHRGVAALVALPAGVRKAEGNVLSNGQSQSRGGALQCKCKPTSIVTDDLLLNELELLELIGLHGRFGTAQDKTLECDGKSHSKEGREQCHDDSLRFAGERGLHCALYSNSGHDAVET
mmetsp:Transcript_15545/g.44982  ORF Transcript_15545/g.44982 Transcript_15545/m.44982 type:complete len:285 (+) Transcript_15545:1135-1989(+)